jgi:hypothetical protein
VEEAARSLGVADLVVFQDTVARSEADRLIDGASVLLLLQQQLPAQVPQKLFDYLGARKPILAFVDDDGESASLLRSVGGHFIVPVGAGDDACADAIISALAAASGHRAVGDDSVLSELTSSRQLGRVVDQVLAAAQRR